MNPNQSFAGYVRQHLHEIEQQLDAGIRQHVIANQLACVGFTVSVKSLRDAVYQARRRAALKAGASTVETTEIKESRNEPVAASVLRPKTDENTASFGSHRPTDLDAIHTQEIDLKSLAKLAKRNPS